MKKNILEQIMSDIRSEEWQVSKIDDWRSGYYNGLERAVVIISKYNKKFEEKNDRQEKKN